MSKKLTNCKACGKEIAKGIKKCPNCGKDNRNFFVKHKILTGIVVLIVLGILASTGNSGTETTKTSSEVQQSIEYTNVNIDTLINDLETNALKANTDYKGKYLEITNCIVSNIDGQGSYFSVRGSDEWSFTNVQIFIDKEHIEQVASLSKGQALTLKVEITDVGEVLGYSADLIEIVQ